MATQRRTKFQHTRFGPLIPQISQSNIQSSDSFALDSFFVLLRLAGFDELALRPFSAGGFVIGWEGGGGGGGSGVGSFTMSTCISSSLRQYVSQTEKVNYQVPNDLPLVARFLALHSLLPLLTSLLSCMFSFDALFFLSFSTSLLPSRTSHSFVFLRLLLSSHACGYLFRFTNGKTRRTLAVHYSLFSVTQLLRFLGE